MKPLIAVVLCLFLPCATFAEAAGYEVAYDGGSIPEKAGTSVYLYNVVATICHNDTI